MSLPHHKYIDNPRDWQECFDRLKSEPRLAIDLEANSLYAYRERVCLIQVSTPAQDYLIDPLANMDLAALGGLLADSAVEKVFHAAEYDLILLKREYGWQLHNLFDTMWAARILGYRRYGLASLLENLFQVRLNKRYQKSNWCKRPLSLAQREYAQLDTHYLLSLRSHLAAELEEAGRTVEAREIFAEQTNVKLPDNEFSPDSFWSINGVHKLSRQQKAVLRDLNIYRDQEARMRDRPPFKIFSNKTMMQMAQDVPKSLRQLRQIHGMTAGQVRRHGKQLLQTIESGMRAAPPQPPKRNNRPPDSVLNRFDRLHRWRKIRARKRGVESDVIISRDALWAIAVTNPRSRDELNDIESVGEWRSQTYGDEILQLLNR